MFLVVIALIVVAFIVGWKWGDPVAAAVWNSVRWLGRKIAEGFTSLWNKIFKKKEA